MGFCDGFAKIILFTFNFIITLCGLAILILGSVLLAKGSDYSTILNDVGSGIKGPQITLVVLGAIIFVIAFLGCCGAIRANKCMLMTYAICLFVIFVAQLAVGIWALVNYDDFKENIGKSLSNFFNNAISNWGGDDMKVFNGLERALHCCGVTGPADYPAYGRQYPASCCGGDINSNTACLSPYLDGCKTALTDFTQLSGKIIGGVAIGLAIIEVVGIFFACCISRRKEF